MFPFLCPRRTALLLLKCSWGLVNSNKVTQPWFCFSPENSLSGYKLHAAPDLLGKVIRQLAGGGSVFLSWGQHSCHAQLGSGWWTCSQILGRRQRQRVPAVCALYGLEESFQAKCWPLCSSSSGGSWSHRSTQWSCNSHHHCRPGYITLKPSPFCVTGPAEHSRTLRSWTSDGDSTYLPSASWPTKNPSSPLMLHFTLCMPLA